MSTIWNELLGETFSQHYYQAGKYRTRVLEAGKGEPLILLHGTGGHAESYIMNLLAHGEHFRTLSVDMIGHGFTDKPSDIEYTIDDYVTHLVDIIDSLGVERAYVSGESLGAIVAAWLAIRHPERVKKIVLNTGILAWPDAKGTEELEDLRQRTLAASEDLTIESVRRRLEWVVHEPKSMPDEIVETRFKIYSQPGVAARMRQIMLKVLEMILDRKAGTYFDPDNLRQIQCPTLVLWTKHNRGQSWEVAKAAAEKIPNKEFYVMKGDCSHWPQLEQRDEFNEVHINFLKQ
jgi:2-hydroxy-6-oxonona-2,4-dienedioate hydrolase